jgi:hypothetical protein
MDDLVIDCGNIGTITWQLSSELEQCLGQLPEVVRNDMLKRVSMYLKAFTFNLGAMMFTPLTFQEKASLLTAYMLTLSEKLQAMAIRERRQHDSKMN